VFLPRSGTRLLAGAMRRLPQVRRGTVLDVCTGSGFVAITAALAGARSVTAVDPLATAARCSIAGFRGR